MSKHIIPFSFESQAIRVVDQDGEPWFVLTDVCKILGTNNPSQAASRLDDDERGIIISDTPSGEQSLLIVNESGLWALVLRSRKPAAKRFRKWVTGEVIPSIRKHGHYAAVDQTPALNDGISAVRETRYTFGKQAARQMWMKMGLPIVPAMLAPPAQSDLFIPA